MNKGIPQLSTLKQKWRAKACALVLHNQKGIINMFPRSWLQLRSVLFWQLPRFKLRLLMIWRLIKRSIDKSWQIKANEASPGIHDTPRTGPKRNFGSLSQRYFWRWKTARHRMLVILESCNAQFDFSLVSRKTPSWRKTKQVICKQETPKQLSNIQSTQAHEKKQKNEKE